MIHAHPSRQLQSEPCIELGENPVHDGAEQERRQRIALPNTPAGLYQGAQQLSHPHPGDAIGIEATDIRHQCVREA